MGEVLEKQSLDNSFNGASEIDPKCCKEGDTYSKRKKQTVSAAVTPFPIRTHKPTKGDEFLNCYITIDEGNGWSDAIVGKPEDSEANVLANCVGYAQGRFCEIYNIIKGTTGNKYKDFSCNAGSFVERANTTYPELKMGQDPEPGAIFCWSGGGTGCGHVAIVERVNPDGSVYTSESGWNGPAFTNMTRSNSNGRGGMGSSYKFRCFIYNPAVTNLPEPVKPVDRDETIDQLKNSEDALRVRTKPSLSGTILGYADITGYYNWYETTEADGYTWYRIADNQGIAQTGALEILNKAPIKYDLTASIIGNGSVKFMVNDEPVIKAQCGDVVKIVESPDQGFYMYKIDSDVGVVDNTFIMPECAVSIIAYFKEVVTNKFEVKDRVRVEHTGNSKSDGTGSTVYHLGEILTIRKVIYSEGHYCYELSSTSGIIIGYYKEEDLTLYSKGTDQEFFIGERIKIKGRGNSRSDGSGYTVFGVGWKEYILDIIEGAEYPYKLGNNGTIQGYYKKSDLTKLNK